MFPIALIVYKASGIPRGTEGRTGTPKGGGIWADERKKREEKTEKEDHERVKERYNNNCLRHSYWLYDFTVYINN